RRERQPKFQCPRCARLLYVLRCGIQYGRYGFQFDFHITSRLPSALHILIQATAEQFIQPRIQTCWHERKVRFHPEHSRENVRNCLPLKRSSPSKHLVEHAAEGKYITTGVDALATRLLRRHI